jgi:integrase
VRRALPSTRLQAVVEHDHQTRPSRPQGAYKRAVRWRWVATSPVVQAEVPAPKPPDPQPPTPAEAAKLIEEASADPDWGALVWFTMTTGARRGEVCALRWRNVDLDARSVQIRRAIATDGRRNLVEKDTKSISSAGSLSMRRQPLCLRSTGRGPRRLPLILGAS